MDMGYKVGLPSLKLNNVGFSSKHCGDFGRVAREALAERLGQDNDINKDLTQLNYYEGFRTAKELIQYSEKHIADLGKKSGKAIRKDAVAMCVTIIKPPAEYMEAFTTVLSETLRKKVPLNKILGCRRKADGRKDF